MTDWYESIAPDNEEHTAIRESLSKFDSADAFFESQAESTKKLETFENANWRDAYAGDDDKFKSTLERFSTEADMGTAYREAQQTIRSGQHNQPPAAEADEKTVTAYREANGIPLEAKGYLENMPDDLVLGEDDMPIAEVFMGALHELHAPPSYAHALIGAYNKWAEQVQDDIAGTDASQHTETEGALRTTWGTDYQANINLVGAFLESTFGEEAKEEMMNGRFADGRAFMNNPKVLEGLAAVQRKLDPVTRLVPPGGDPIQTLHDELAEIDKFRREHRTEYFKDEKMQARERELIDIRNKHEEKTAA